jgi:uncharacterized membrane protein YjjB (DUF3815 family)
MNGVELAEWIQPFLAVVMAVWTFVSHFPIIGNVFWAAIAAFGFAMLFNAPKYALPYCALIGAVGYAARAELMSAGVGIIQATLLAALLIGVLATIFARRFVVSEIVFALSPAIPMVPGSYVYKAVMHMVVVANAPHLEHENEELLMAAFNESAKAALIILLLSFGIALPGLVWSTFRRSE